MTYLVRIIRNLAPVIPWLFFAGLIVAFFSKGTGTDMIGRMLGSGWFWLFCICYITLYYTHTLWLIPAFFLKGRYLAYSLAVVASVALVLVTEPFEHLIFRKFRTETGPHPPPAQSPPHFGDRHAGLSGGDGPRLRPARNTPGVDIVSLVLFGMVWSFGLFTATSAEWKKSREQVLRSQADKAQAELSFVKAQLNPHFLFNTLNNLYSLAAVQSPETAPGILKLSRIMRYITEESVAENVALNEEVAFIRDYIELQRLRLNARTRVVTHFDSDFGDLQIAPLLLIPFVENAFKYGVSSHFDALIEVGVEAGEGMIRFRCRNPIQTGAGRGESTGIGLANTRRRLDHHYPQRYTLTISEQAPVYLVELILFPTAEAKQNYPGSFS